MAQVRENGGNGWEPTAELVEALCGDLAQARQALQRIATHADGQPFSVYRSYYAEVRDIAREALVETREEDLGGARGARAQEGSNG